MRAAPLYPFLAAVYPVLLGAAGNTHLGVTTTDLWLPLAVALAVAGFLWLATGTFFQDPTRRALVATLVVVFLFWYGYLVAGLEAIGVPAEAVRHEWVFPTSAILTASGVLLVGRMKRLPAGLTPYLNLAFGILVVFPVIGFGRHVITGGVQHDTEHLATLESPVSLQRPTEAPDIYFIVLDAYTGSESLKRLYDFDNAEFERGLRERGFIVPRSQRANYVVTFLSLASILNWDYVHRLVPVDPESADQTPIYPLIESNRTVHVFRDLGYRFVFFPTSLAMSNRNRSADLLITSRRGCCNLLLQPWLRSTALFPLHLWTHHWMEPVLGGGLPFSPESAEEILWKFEQLERLPELDEPLFVLVHLILPHEPFHFHADCTVRRPAYWPVQVTPREERRARSAYVEQLQCTNRLVLRLLDRLLKGSDRPPVILLQSDHGYALGAPLSLDRSTADYVAERIDVFAAYHLPGIDPGAIPKELTAVNLFRLVLSKYFRAPLPLIDDATYWSAFARPYDLIRIWPEEGSGLQ